MPVYDFSCEKCKRQSEIKLSFAEYADSKINGIPCECGAVLVRMVSPLRFKLKGWGWYASESTQGVDPYGISDREIATNLDNERRAEDEMHESAAKMKDCPDI